VIALVLAAGVVLVACSSPDRMAAPVEEAEIAVSASNSGTRDCPTQSSSASYWTVTNRTPISLVLNADDYSCESWSGRSTPGNAFNNLVLEPGQSAKVRLEYSVWTSEFPWTFSVVQHNTDENLGRFITDFSIHQDKVLPAFTGGDRVSAPAGSQVGTNCSALTLGFTPLPETPGQQWDGLNVRNQMITFVIFNGRLTALASCKDGDGKQTGNYANWAKG